MDIRHQIKQISVWTLKSQTVSDAMTTRRDVTLFLTFLLNSLHISLHNTAVAVDSPLFSSAGHIYPIAKQCTYIVSLSSGSPLFNISLYLPLICSCCHAPLPRHHPVFTDLSALLFHQSTSRSSVICHHHHQSLDSMGMNYLAATQGRRLSITKFPSRVLLPRAFCQHLTISYHMLLKKTFIVFIHLFVMTEIYMCMEVHSWPCVNLC